MVYLNSSTGANNPVAEMVVNVYQNLVFANNFARKVIVQHYIAVLRPHVFKALLPIRGD